MKKTDVGSLRPSQILWTYGPGALIDLPNLSVITMGLEKWDINDCEPIHEARLLVEVRKKLGPQVERLLSPPISRTETRKHSGREATIGMPVRAFPRWLRCTRCGLLASLDSGLFELKENPYRPDRTKYLHTSCEKGEHSDAVPARFLLACSAGHLDDFPWHWFVHKGNSDCRGTLRFYELGALQTANLIIKCDTCENTRSMVEAFGKAARENLPTCRGRHPHLDSFDENCPEDARTILLGSANSWFSIPISVLAIPILGNSLLKTVKDGWVYFEDAEEAEIPTIVRMLKKTNKLVGIQRYSPKEIWNVVQRQQMGETSEVLEDVDIKVPEWEVLTHPNPPSDFPHFLSKQVLPPTGFEKFIKKVLILERLREVNALVGFTRVDSPDRTQHQQTASLSVNPPTWVPAAEVHGEGIFICFDEEVLKRWETQKSVQNRALRLKKGHQGWRNQRGLDPDDGFPGIRYTMLHTLAHLLIREFALECGYNAASIRERLYATPYDEPNPMGGILLYTASTDSDGTLGGLAELGNPENLGRMIRQALHRALICSSDPLCSEHNPGKDRSLHLAACHACTFVSETSCESGNHYLDRGLLVETFDSKNIAFFEE